MLIEFLAAFFAIVWAIGKLLEVCASKVWQGLKWIFRKVKKNLLSRKISSGTARNPSKEYADSNDFIWDVGTSK